MFTYQNFAILAVPTTLIPKVKETALSVLKKEFFITLGIDVKEEPISGNRADIRFMTRKEIGGEELFSIARAIEKLNLDVLVHNTSRHAFFNISQKVAE